MVRLSARIRVWRLVKWENWSGLMAQIPFYFYFNFNTLSTCNEVRYTQHLRKELPPTYLQLPIWDPFSQVIFLPVLRILENFGLSNDILGRGKGHLKLAQEIRVVFDHDTWKFFPKRYKKVRKRKTSGPSEQ